MDKHSLQYFLNLIGTNVALCGYKPILVLDQAISDTLQKNGVTSNELYGENPDLSSYKTICLCFPDDKFVNIDLKKILLENPNVETIIVQTINTYDHAVHVTKGLNITIIGFKQGAAVFINYDICTGNPFFLVDLQTIPKDDILDWVGWSEQTED
jgi:hypothetical protein